MCNSLKIGFLRYAVGATSIAVLFLCCVPIWAQSSDVAPEPPRVYVTDFTQQGSDPNLSELSTFTAGLIRLQLLRMPMIDVVRTVERPPCGEEGKHSTGSLDTSGQIAPNAAGQPTARSAPARVPVPSSGNFYVIRGSIDIRPPDIAVDAMLEKCNGGTLATVTSDHALFVAGKALEQLTVLSQFLANELESSLPKTGVKVADFKSVDRESDRTAADVTEQIKLELTRHPGFELTDSTEYLVEGEVAKVGDTLKTTVRIHWGHDDLKTVESTGAANHASVFVRNVGTSVYDSLAAVLLAQRFGWKDYLDNQDAESFVERGKRLLCIDQAASCRVDAQSALGTMSRAAQLSPASDWHTKYYLGLAQTAALKYSAAIATFNSVLASIRADPAKNSESSKIMIDSLNQLGDLYAKSGDSKTAGTYYDESLKLDRTQSELYIRQAATLLDSETPAAINVLLDGLAHASDKAAIHFFLQNSLRRVETPDFDPIVEVLRSAVSRGEPVSEEYAILCANLASQLVEIDPNRAQELIRRAQTLPGANVSLETKNWLTRILTASYLRQQKYADAYDSAEKARDQLNDPSTQILMAQVELAWASHLEESDRSNLEAVHLLQDAYAILKPLVQASNDDAYPVIRDVGHRLSKDLVVLTVFADLAAKNPKDLEALRNQMYVCNEFLYDFSCAYSAAKKLYTGPVEDVGLQLDAVEIAVLNRDYKQASAWLEPVDGASDPSVINKTVARFYRFWITYAQNGANTAQDFQRLLQSLNESAAIRTAVPTSQLWSFDGAKHALAKSDLPAEKRKLLADIITAFEDPAKGTTQLRLTDGT
jgi:tetratricopeptide (TPR) repeat protein